MASGRKKTEFMKWAHEFAYDTWCWAGKNIIPKKRKLKYSGHENIDHVLIGGIF